MFTRDYSGRRLGKNVQDDITSSLHIVAWPFAGNVTEAHYNICKDYIVACEQPGRPGRSETTPITEGGLGRIRVKHAMQLSPHVVKI